MNDTVDRRTILKSAAATAIGMATSELAAAAAAEGLKLADPVAFTYEAFKTQARVLAQAPYVGPPRPAPDVVQKINYEEWGKIKFRDDHALFAEGPGRFPLTFFHLGVFFPKAIEIHVVDAGQSRKVVYDQSYFDMPADSPARQIPAGSGFAGFRIQEARDGALDWHKNDWVAFLGAAYFRSIGELRQYGMSSRGVALDVAVADRSEEFPDFTKFYVESNEAKDGVVIYALMEGPSIVGAYRFDMKRGKGVVMEIDAALYLRNAIARFGIAPLTSMYWYSETKKETAIDWRPEVHDSDGLAMWSGNGERLWRPLNNPPRTMVSAFGDNNPRGFGLLQRDRIFDHYLDGVNYDRRPSVWVEPLANNPGEGWGKGSIQLCEIPTDDEIHDNIVAMWVPEKPIVAGSEVNLRYRLHWLADEPYPSTLGRCVATRIGNGGQPGLPRPKGVRKFMVEFLGGPLSKLPYGVKPEPVISVSRGTILAYKVVEAVPDDVPGHWRVQFDLAVDGNDPVEMRCFFKSDTETLTETWMFQYHPF